MRLNVYSENNKKRGIVFLNGGVTSLFWVPQMRLSRYWHIRAYFFMHTPFGLPWCNQSFKFKLDIKLFGSRSELRPCSETQRVC